MPKKARLQAIKVCLKDVVNYKDEACVSNALGTLVDLTGGSGSPMTRRRTLSDLGLESLEVKAAVSPLLGPLAAVLSKFKSNDDICLGACAVMGTAASPEVLEGTIIPALTDILAALTINPLVVRALASAVVELVGGEPTPVRAACLPLLSPLAAVLAANPSNPVISEAVGKAVVGVITGASSLKHGAVEAGLVTAFDSVIDAQKDLKDKAGSIAACEALRVLARGSQACKVACLPATPSLLFAMAAHCDSPDVVDHACAALASIAGGGRQCREFLLGLAGDFFPTLTAAATHHAAATPSVGEHVCLFFREMAAAGGEQGGEKGALLHHGIVPQLLGILATHGATHPPIALHVCATLALLCGVREGAEVCLDGGVVGVMERVLESKAWGAPVLTQATRCLGGCWGSRSGRHHRGAAAATAAAAAGGGWGGAPPPPPPRAQQQWPPLVGSAFACPGPSWLC